MFTETQENVILDRCMNQTGNLGKVTNIMSFADWDKKLVNFCHVNGIYSVLTNAYGSSEYSESFRLRRYELNDT